MFLLAFVAGWLQGHWWGFISRNYLVWPTFLLMNVFIALKRSHFWFLFVNMHAPLTKSYGDRTLSRELEDGAWYMLVLLVKRNTLILYSYFHWMLMFLLKVSMTFYRCTEKRHSKSFLPHFSTSVEILLKSWGKLLLASACKLRCINFLIGFKMLGFKGYISCLQLLHLITVFIHNRAKNYTKAAFKTWTQTSGQR